MLLNQKSLWIMTLNESRSTSLPRWRCITSCSSKNFSRGPTKSSPKTLYYYNFKFRNYFWCVCKTFSLLYESYLVPRLLSRIWKRFSKLLLRERTWSECRVRLALSPWNLGWKSRSPATEELTNGLQIKLWS